jgi:hypothetical protein
MFQRNIWGCEFILFNVKKKYIKVEDAHEITSYVQEHTAIKYTAMLEKLYNVMSWYSIFRNDCPKQVHIIDNPQLITLQYST